MNSEGKIFGLSKNPLSSTTWTFTLDINSLEFKYIKEIPEFNDYYLSTTAYDLINQRLFALGEKNTIFIFNTTTGELVSTIPFLYTFDSSESVFKLIKANPDSGNYEIFGKLDGIKTIYPGCICIDINQNIIYMLSGDKSLYSVNSTTGMVISSVSLSHLLLNPFVNNDGEIFGIYWNEEKQAQYLEKIEFSTGAIEEICVITGLTTFSQGRWTFDYNTNRFIQFGYPNNEKTEPHLFIIQVRNSNPFNSIDGFHNEWIMVCISIWIVLKIEKTKKKRVF